MSDLLFLAHRAPFPPDRGDRIRGWHILRHLAARTRVHLAAFVDRPEDAAVPAELRAMLGETVILPRRRSRASATLAAMASGRPMSVAMFDDPRMHAAVARLRREHPIGTVYAFSGQMGQYLPTDGRTIMDFVDRDSAKFAAYADDAHGPMRWLMRREARLLSRFEDAIAAHASASLFVSAEEAALLSGARAIENGIDAARYDPAAVTPIAEAGPLIVFTGQMDYQPNVEAVVRFARDAMPAIRHAHPAARFAIVGRAPTGEVRALASDAVIVTGEVADVRPWLGAAAVVVAPLALARGIQNKVLEAMAMARPVVASAAAAEGIDHAGTILVDDAPAAAVIDLLADRARAEALGRAARARVLARYDWASTLAPLDALFDLPARRMAA